MLPSGYVSCSGVMPLSKSYINTGVTAKSTLSIDALFSGMGYYTASGYVFGARNSNSNTSAGQVNYYHNSTSTCYFGYASARTNMGSAENFGGESRQMHFYNVANECEVISQSGYTLTGSGSVSTFTGSRPIFIFGLNNAGSLANWMQISLHGFIIKDDNTVVFDGEPAYEEASSKYGVYDRQNNTFYPLSSARAMYRVDFSQTTGGQAYARTFRKEYVKSIYGADNTNKGYDLITCVAMAEKGYEFFNWTDSNGNIVSTEKEFIYSATADVTLTANFIPIVAGETETGYKALFLKYAGYTASSLPSIRDDTYAEVLSGSVTVDSMQRVTSQFVLKELPSTIQKYCPMFLYSPKGAIIYQGIVWSINGKTITCREPIAIWDEDYLFKTNTNIDGWNYTKYIASRGIVRYLFLMENFVADGTSTYNYLGRRKHEMVRAENDVSLLLREVDNLTVCTPLISGVSVSNMEDFMFEIFQMGVYVKANLATKSEIYSGQTVTRHYMKVTPFYYRENDPVVMGDNVENVKNVSVTIDEAETTVLALFNSTGATLKGFYSIDNNGSVTKYDTFSQADLVNLLGYNNYKLKIVMSDDTVKTVIAQNLSNAKYGHKITFDLMLDNGNYRWDSLKVGQPVTFYVENKMYDSVVTGIQFDFEQHDNIHRLKVTLGNARTNLTSKLNLGRK